MAGPESAPTRPAQPNWQSCAFGPFRFFPLRQLLLKDGSPVRIGGRALELLNSLLRKSGEVVSKRELLEQVWPGQFVDEANLKVNMSALRRALGEGSDATEYIVTVMGRGYRFIAPVSFGGESPPPATPARPEPIRRHNLTVSTTRILGRVDAIESISLDVVKSKLVSILGPGGVGKSTVAKAIAERFIDKFRDGVWLVDLTAIKDPTLIPNAVALAMGRSGQLPTTIDALCELLVDRETLLLLDNCEHLIGAIADFANRVLTTDGGVKLLVTSREPIMLSGERARRLPGLAMPPKSTQLTSAEALRYSAIQLFVERATESFEGFELADIDAGVVAEICRQLDGLALAIELAASRVEAFGVSGLLRQLESSRLPLISSRSVPERHRTLTATIEWSYGLLSEIEARILLTVSAFAGSFDADGAAAVAEVPTQDASRCLAQLASKSLLSIVIHEDKIAYRLLETTRAFCQERLRYDSSHIAIAQRHARYICQLIERATREWVERPNSKLAENYDRALTDLYTAICTSTMASPALMFQAMDAMRRAVEIASEFRDAEAELRSLRILGVYEMFTGEPRSALRTFERHAKLIASHEPQNLVESESLIAVALLFLGRLEESRALCEKLYAQELTKDDEARGGKTFSDPMWLLPQPRWLTGSPDAASQLALAAIDYMRRTAEKTVLMNNSLVYAVAVFYWCGHYEACNRLAIELEKHSERHGFYPRRPIARLFLAVLASHRGASPEENILVVQSAIEELREANHLARMPYFQALLAELLAQQQRFDEATKAINSAIASIRAQGEEWCLPEVLRVRASIFSGLGDEDGAEAALAVAMQKAHDMGALSWELRAANDLASLWMRQARHVEARAMLEPVHGRFTEGHGTRDLINAARLLRELNPERHG